MKVVFIKPFHKKYCQKFRLSLELFCCIYNSKLCNCYYTAEEMLQFRIGILLYIFTGYWIKIKLICRLTKNEIKHWSRYPQYLSYRLRTFSELKHPLPKPIAKFSALFLSMETKTTFVPLKTGMVYPTYKKCQSDLQNWVAVRQLQLIISTLLRYMHDKSCWIGRMGKKICPSDLQLS